MNQSTEPIVGQWIGTSSNSKGEQASLLVVNVEARTPGKAQILTTSFQDPKHRTCALAKLSRTGDEVTGEISAFSFVDAATSELISSDEYYRRVGAKRPPPKTTKFQCAVSDSVLDGAWKSDFEDGRFRLENCIGQPPLAADMKLSWGEFKDFVSEQCVPNPGLFFRGHRSNRFKLRSSFHRCGRNDLHAYLEVDIPNLVREVNAVSPHLYNPRDAEDFGALLSLAQHHGYPTPLLDWTLSPYVAAFFAFDGSRAAKDESVEYVRIYVFNSSLWEQGTNNRSSLRDPIPNISFHQFAAHNNPRCVPQQAIASFTSVDDMEDFFRRYEKRKGRKPLVVIDIPVQEERRALRELHLMGITAATLFPGLDGVCRSLRAGYFE